MVKCFVTGDNHFGRPYEGKLSEIKDCLTDARYESLKNMVKHANEENCDLFIVTGDLFEKTDIEYIGGNNKSKGEAVVQRVIDILKDFKRTVLILPGNHDYENDSSTVWKSFTRQSTNYNHMIVLNEFRKISLGEINGNEVVIYPSYCQSEHSDTNNLDWIKNEEIETDNIVNIGLAHGTIEGLSCDNEGVYFKMPKKELEEIPVDVWFIGHAHVPYPKNIYEDKLTKNEKIYNAGTHQQTDIGNSSEGYGFIVEIEKNGDNATISAKKWKSGIISFHDVTVKTIAESNHALRDALQAKIAEICETHDLSKCVVRFTFKGTAKPDEYENKDDIYQELTKDIMFCYQPDWYDYSEEITSKKIKEEFSENSIVAQFLNSFINGKGSDADENNAELNLAYQLINSIKNSKR